MLTFARQNVIIVLSNKRKNAKESIQSISRIKIKVLRGGKYV
jgi:hypothetical protein